MMRILFTCLSLFLYHSITLTDSSRCRVGTEIRSELRSIKDVAEVECSGEKTCREARAAGIYFDFLDVHIVVRECVVASGGSVGGGCGSVQEAFRTTHGKSIGVDPSQIEIEVSSCNETSCDADAIGSMLPGALSSAVIEPPPAERVDGATTGGGGAGLPCVSKVNVTVFALASIVATVVAIL